MQINGSLSLSPMPKTYKYSPNLFCYICGSFTIKAQRRAITSDLEKNNTNCISVIRCRPI